MYTSETATSRPARRALVAAGVVAATASAVVLGASPATAVTTRVTSPTAAQHAVSCASSPARKATKTRKAVKAVTMCLSVGGPSGKRTWARYNGSSWSKPKGITHVGSGVSCVTPTFCVAVGDNDAAVFNGRAWSSPKAVSASTSLLSSVSCAKVASCVAVGTADAGAVATTYNGKSWTRPTTIIKGASFAPAVSCTTSLCMAVEGSTIAIERGGRWSAGTNDNAIQLTAVSCVGTSRCVLTDLYGRALVWNGRAYTPVTAPSSDPDGFIPLDAVSCVSSTWCAIGGSNSAQSAPQLFVLSGTSFARPSTPRTATGTNTVAGVDCLSPAFCAAAAEQDRQA